MFGSNLFVAMWPQIGIKNNCKPLRDPSGFERDISWKQKQKSLPESTLAMKHLKEHSYRTQVMVQSVGMNVFGCVIVYYNNFKTPWIVQVVTNWDPIRRTVIYTKAPI